jgi:hypothetical protein
MPENVKGDYITLRLPDFSPVLGCSVNGDDPTCHVGLVFKRITACGRAMGDVLITSTITVTCPDCLAEMRYRKKHPEAARQQFGVVTHK